MIKIKFEKEKNRSIALDDEKLIGQCNYIEQEESWNIIHTEVSSEYQGRGIAKQLVENIIKEAKELNKAVIADCSYAKKILEKNVKK